MRPEIVFKAMADRTRQRVLVVLRRQELSVSEIVVVLRRPQSTVSRHLKVLRDAGLIQDRRDGNVVLYSVPASIGQENGADLSNRLLGWISDQPVPDSLRSRLDAVIQARREMSRRFFDRIGHQWDALREESFGSSFHLEAFLALLPRNWTVADVGTGTGYLLPTLARHFRRVIGIEPVGTMLEGARHRIEFHGVKNVELCNGDLVHLPITDSTVDLTVAVLVIHHGPTPQDAVAELCRITRSGGCVLVVEQAAHQQEAFHERMQDRWWGFEPAEFGGLLESVGFENVEWRGLVTARSAVDAPDLFVITGRKPADDRE